MGENLLYAKMAKALNRGVKIFDPKPNDRMLGSFDGFVFGKMPKEQEESERMVGEGFSVRDLLIQVVACLDLKHVSHLPQCT